MGMAFIFALLLKGIGPVLALLKEGLVGGSSTPDDKECSAQVMVDVIALSSANMLVSGRFVMSIAGPLIRVLGDRYSGGVKVAVLQELVVLVRKVPVLLTYPTLPLYQCHFAVIHTHPFLLPLGGPSGQILYSSAPNVLSQGSQ